MLLFVTPTITYLNILRKNEEKQKKQFASGYKCFAYTTSILIVVGTVVAELVMFYVLAYANKIKDVALNRDPTLQENEKLAVLYDKGTTWVWTHMLYLIVCSLIGIFVNVHLFKVVRTFADHGLTNNEHDENYLKAP